MSKTNKDTEDHWLNVMNPEEINRVFHEQVAGKVYYRKSGILLPDSVVCPNYFEDANAVLPYLNRYSWSCEQLAGEAGKPTGFFRMMIFGHRPCDGFTFSQAAVSALLMLRGIKLQ